MKKVLVVCTGNSCRSIMAEALMNHLGAGRLQAFSAGSQPTGKVHPESLATLKRHGLRSDGYKSKSWDEFKGQELDIVITVCDSAASETCPFFPGAPLRTHWGAPDPAHFLGTQAEIEADFDRVFLILKSRVAKLVELPIEDMDTGDLQKKLHEIGQQEA